MATNEVMSTPTPIAKLLPTQNVSKQAYGPVDPEDEAVEQFLTRIRFFPTPHEIAQKILLLNQELGDELIESQLAELTAREESSDEKLIEVSENEVSDNWLHTIINRVSSILFNEEESSEQMNASQEEVVVLFQKTVSEKIYDRLSLLSLSPHAKKGGTFSLTEELTKGIAEDIGLGLYRRKETREELRNRAEATLLTLATEFQTWLLEEWKGVYPAGWGEIRARFEDTTEESTGPVVWLDPDVKMHRSAAAES